LHHRIAWLRNGAKVRASATGGFPIAFVWRNPTEAIMATRMQRNTQQQRGTMRGRRTSQREVGGDGQFGVDNLTYDLVSILHEKSKALEAYGKYLQDARQNDEVLDLIQRIREQDKQQVRELRDCLADVIRGNGGM
jgi:hypothetical protein